MQSGVRLLIAAPLFALGWHLVDSAGWGLAAALQLVIGMACFLAVAVIVGTQIARLAGITSGRLHYRPDASRRPASDAIYKVAEIKRQQGLYEEAMGEYGKIADRFPNELRPYLEMIDIAAHDMRDRDRALAAFRKGITSLAGQRDRKKLRSAQEDAMTRLKKRG